MSPFIVCYSIKNISIEKLSILYFHFNELGIFAEAARESNVLAESHINKWNKTTDEFEPYASGLNIISWKYGEDYIFSTSCTIIDEVGCIFSLKILHSRIELILDALRKSNTLIKHFLIEILIFLGSSGIFLEFDIYCEPGFYAKMIENKFSDPEAFVNGTIFFSGVDDQIAQYALREGFRHYNFMGVELFEKWWLLNEV